MSFIVKNTTTLNPINILCPHSCMGCGQLGESLCKCCKKNITVEPISYCPNCHRIITHQKCDHCHLPPTFILGWRDELIGQMAEAYKYQSIRSLAHIFADLLNDILPEIHGKVAIVPLPTITTHVRARGFDHTYQIAKHLAKIRGWQVKKLITRAKNTVQVGANEKTRILQASQAYNLSGTIDPTTTYIIFDDIWTTGASVKAALKKLRQAGASKIIITTLALSRTRQH